MIASVLVAGLLVVNTAVANEKKGAKKPVAYKVVYTDKSGKNLKI